jgi:hypothetical protein
MGGCQGGTVRQAWECVVGPGRVFERQEGLQLFDSYAPFLLLRGSSATLKRSREGRSQLLLKHFSWLWPIGAGTGAGRARSEAEGGGKDMEKKEGRGGNRRR